MSTMIDKPKLLRTVFGRNDIKFVPTDVALEEALAGLLAQHRFVLEHRFCTPPMTLKAIGLIYPRPDGGIGVTPERIRQIEARCLRLLRHPKRVRLLCPKSEWPN